MTVDTDSEVMLHVYNMLGAARTRGRHRAATRCSGLSWVGATRWPRRGEQREGARRAFDGTGQDVETGTRGETGTRVPRTHLKHAGSLSQKHWEVVG